MQVHIDEGSAILSVCYLKGNTRSLVLLFSPGITGCPAGLPSLQNFSLGALYGF